MRGPLNAGPSGSASWSTLSSGSRLSSSVAMPDGEPDADLRVVRVAPAVRLGHHPAQPAARVEHGEDQLLVAVAGGELLGDELEQIGLAALVVAQDQQVLVVLEQVEEYGVQRVLVERRSGSASARRPPKAAAAPAAGSATPVPGKRVHRARWRGRAGRVLQGGAEIGGRGDRVGARKGGLREQLAVGEHPARGVLGRASRTACGRSPSRTGR